MLRRMNREFFASRLRPLWADWRRGATVAAGLGILSGVAVGIGMPRGPITSGEAIGVMITGALVGAAAGLAMGSRWAMLLTPVVHAAAFEVARIGTSGPSVDGIRLDNGLGAALFVAGRVFHGIVGLAPMVLGAAIGAGIARQLTPELFPDRPILSRVATFVRRAAAVISGAILVSLALAIVQPATTAPIVDDDGNPVAGSVAALEAVRLGGHDQWIMMRGRSIDAPVLLYLTGGPGNSDLGYTRAFLEDLEEDFVFVAWDQRGAGKSYPALDPTSTLTLDQAVADTIELTNYLRDRFDEEKIYLLGNSWGSVLGVLAVQQHPELYHAYIGAGQMVNPLETDRRLYRQMIDYATRTGDETLAETTRGYGEPPYGDVFAYAVVIEHYDDLEPYTQTETFRKGTSGIAGTGVSEYSFVEKANVLRGLADMGSVLYPQAQDIDFRRDAPRLEVPVYLVQGAHELTARADLAQEYFAQLEAPSKELIVFEHSGHVPHFEEPARFHEVMVNTVLAETYPAG